LSELKKDRIKEAFKNEEINCNRQAQSTPSSSVLLASSPAPTPSTSKYCDWCNSPTHSTAECRSMAAAKQSAKKAKKRPNPNASASPAIEQAGNASLSVTPSDPNSPLILDAHFDWNADTGPTSHMTPHCHWFSSYAPHHVPIKLADNNIVYSAGIGSVVFIPRVNGSEM